MESFTRRLKPPYGRALRREDCAQPGMDAEIRRRLRSKACAARKNQHGAEVVASPITGGCLGNDARDRASGASGLRLWRPASVDGQSTCRQAEHSHDFTPA